VWKKTDKWRPARSGTASAGYGVENTATGGIGFAKSTFAHREKLASDLAARVGVTVPKVELDHVEGATQLHAISFAHRKESIDVPLLRDRLADRFNSPEVQDAIRRASGLLPFYAWVATTDVKDEHLVVTGDGVGGYMMAAIDFAFSLAWQQDDGGTVSATNAPQSMTSIDQNAVATVVSSIESVSEKEIEDFVNSLPAELVPPDEKRRLIRGLLARRDKIREAMKAKGWLP
jgi:hypothetical protein